MSQGQDIRLYREDYIKALRMAEGLGIKVSPTTLGQGRPERLDSDGNPIMAVITQEKLDRLMDELEMCHMIIKHFDNNLRKMEKDLNQASKHMQEIARYRLSWMVGELPVDIFDNEEVV